MVTRISTKDKTQIKLLEALSLYEAVKRQKLEKFNNDKPLEDDTLVSMTRFDLRKTIIGKLNIFDRNQISAYINWLLENEFLEMHLECENDEFLPQNAMPKNTTRYLIDRDWINTRLKELTEKTDLHSHSTLEKFFKPDGVSIKMVQEEKTVNLK